MRDAAARQFAGFGSLDPQELERLLDQLPVVCWSTDRALQITSRRGGGLHALDPSPLPTDVWRIGDVVENPAQVERAIAAHQAALRGEATAYEITFGGRAFSARVEPLRNGDQICGVVGIAFDITETKRADEELRTSRAALRSLAARQQDVRESERSRIAREIHDRLGQALTALKLQLVATHEEAASSAPDVAERLCEAAGMVDDLVKSVRRIATELRPPILDHLGLPAAVEWLAHDFSRRNAIVCETSIAPINSAISGELGTALFRIVQEALTNVSRHADASRVDITLAMKSDCLTLEINDDGLGITASRAIGPGSLGILGMRERAAALGGVLEVAPRPDGGTRVAAWFPPSPLPKAS